MLIPSIISVARQSSTSLSRGMNANSQHSPVMNADTSKSIKRDEC